MKLDTQRHKVKIRLKGGRSGGMAYIYLPKAVKASIPSQFYIELNPNEFRPREVTAKEEKSL